MPLVHARDFGREAACFGSVVTRLIVAMMGSCKLVHVRAVCDTACLFRFRMHVVCCCARTCLNVVKREWGIYHRDGSRHEVVLLKSLVCKV